MNRLKTPLSGGGGVDKSFPADENSLCAPTEYTDSFSRHFHDFEFILPLTDIIEIFGRWYKTKNLFSAKHKNCHSTVRPLLCNYMQIRRNTWYLY